MIPAYLLMGQIGCALAVAVSGCLPRRVGLAVCCASCALCGALAAVSVAMMASD